MLINKADKYDIRGKRILNVKYKYYLTDLELVQVKNIGKRPQYINKEDNYPKYVITMDKHNFSQE